MKPRNRLALFPYMSSLKIALFGIWWVALVFAALSSTATAQERLLEYSPGQQLSLTLAPGEAVEKIAFYTRSEGNEALSARISIEAPVGLAITLRHLGFPSGTSTQQMLSSSRAFDIAELARPGKITFRETSILGDSEDPRKKKKQGKIRFICNGRLDARTQGLYEALFGFTYGYKPTLEELCRFALGGTEAPPPGATIVKEELRGVIYKNACSAKLSYLVATVLDLASIPAALRAQGFTINFKMDLIDYQGPDNFKVKKMGEGRFKEPLLLGETVQTDDTFQQTHVFLRYSGGKIKNQTTLKIKKATYYRDMGLIVTTPRGLLTGGKAVACTSNSAAASCNCIKARALDQLFRGYTN